MANALFDDFKREQLGDAAGSGHGVVDFEADTIKAGIFDDTDVAVDPETHIDYADISAAVVGTPGAIGTKTVVVATGTATFDGDPVTLSSVTGDQCETINIYKDSGVAGTSLLIVHFDTATGLPVTPNGGDITITWNASGIFTW